MWFNRQPLGPSRFLKESSNFKQVLQFEPLSYFRKKNKGNTMLPTPHFWNNLDMNTDCLTWVLSMPGKVRKWFKAGPCVSRASQSVVICCDTQKHRALRVLVARLNLLLKLQTVLNQLLKKKLPLDGRLFFLLSLHLFPLLTETQTRPESHCALIVLPCHLEKHLHWQFTLQGPSSASDFQKVYLAHLSEKYKLLIISSKWYICLGWKQEKHQAFHNSDFFLPSEFLKVSMSFYPFHCGIRIYVHLSC